MTYYTGHGVTVHHADALDLLPTLADCSVDAVVTDPPYSLAFMNRAWDTHPTPTAYQAWCQAWAAECLRVLKPGGHLLAFGGTRTSHRLTSGIEDAGFEIRDSIIWIYGSGFPKSLDVSKAIDARHNAGNEKRRPDGREVVGMNAGVAGRQSSAFTAHRDSRITNPATDEARRWAGWGTALKPGHEPVVCARKPLQGTVAANVLEWGTGAINIDGCRVGNGEDRVSGGLGGMSVSQHLAMGEGWHVGEIPRPTGGRWPANVILDEATAAELDAQSGERPTGDLKPWSTPASVFAPEQHRDYTRDGDTGGASRFFYTAKADTAERIRLFKDGAGDHRSGSNFAGGIRECNICGNRTKPPGNWTPTDVRPWPACGHDDWTWGTPHEQTGYVSHPTVKPLDLMRYLCRGFTPPGGLVLDPFAGSGTTAEACLLEGFRCIAVEREADYLPMIVARVTRRRDPVAYIKASGEDGGLFDLKGAT